MEHDMNWNYEGIAAGLYEKYCQAVGGVNFQGDPLPNWQEFRADPNKTKQSDAWIKVAEESVELITGALRA